MGCQFRGGLAPAFGVFGRRSDGGHSELGVWDSVVGAQGGYTRGVCHLGVLGDGREFGVKLDGDSELLSWGLLQAFGMVGAYKQRRCRRGQMDMDILDIMRVINIMELL